MIFVLEAAELIVINSCAIREAAEQKVIGRMGHLARLKADNPHLRVVLTGCSVRENNRPTLQRRYPAVDLFLRPLPNQTGSSKDYGFWMTLLDGKLSIRYNHFRTDQINFRNGDIMVIEDHINLMCDSPLIGINDDRLGLRFPDMCEPYDQQLIDRALEVARRENFNAHKGVFVAVSGPNLETRAEYRFLRVIGADAVGMSTVPEAIVAKHMGLKVAGLSMLANVAAGITGKAIHHDEVLSTATQMNADIGMLLQRFFETYEQ